MNTDAEDPLLAAAARICDGVPVDWRNVGNTGNPALETIASELEWIEHFARASGAPRRGAASALSGTRTRSVWHGLPGGGLQPADRGGAQNRPAASRRAVRLRARDAGGATARQGPPSCGRPGLRREANRRRSRVVNGTGRGQNVDEIVRDQGPFSASEAALIGMDLCRALAAVTAPGYCTGTSRPTT